MRAWEMWLALLLLLVGSGCLVTAVQLWPVGSLSEQMVTGIRMIRPLFMILVFFLLVWFMWRGRVQQKRTQSCSSCGYQMAIEWRYCPHCGGMADNGKGSDRRPGKDV